MSSRAPLLFALVSAAIPYAAAQSVISARSGLINFAEGDVVVDGHKFEKTFGSYTRLREGSDLVTRSGRAEVLLAPNSYLRVGADSAIRMVSDSLTDTRVELVHGSAMLDSAGADAATSVTILFKDETLRMAKPGKYRVDAEPPQLRVYQGEAEIAANGVTSQLGPSQVCPLDGASVVRRFTDGSDNLLDIWSDERRILISSKMNDLQAIYDPLTDPDPNTSPGLDAYLGYLPLGGVPASSGSLPAYGVSGLGYPGGYGGGYGLGYGIGYGAYGPGLYGGGAYYGYLAPVLARPVYRPGNVYLSQPLSISRPSYISVRPSAGGVALPTYRPGATTLRAPIGVRAVGRR